MSLSGCSIANIECRVIGSSNEYTVEGYHHLEANQMFAATFGSLMVLLCLVKCFWEPWLGRLSKKISFNECC